MQIITSNLIVNTVHSVKGQTHFSTLYMELFLFGEYESTSLERVFSGISSLDLIEELKANIRDKENEITTLKARGKRGAITLQSDIEKLKVKINNIKKYSKMIYVGFSRPTHFLCFAVEKNRFDKLNINTDIWDVKKLNQLN